jgi:hypothetical protein
MPGEKFVPLHTKERKYLSLWNSRKESGICGNKEVFIEVRDVLLTGSTKLRD